MSFTLDPAERSAYERDGLLCLRGGVDRQDALTMQGELWHALARKHGMHPAAPSSWTVPRPSGLSRLIHRDAFASMASVTVTATLDTLLGHAAWMRPARWGVPLVSFPDASAEWDVPCEQWHLDSPAVAEAPAIARVFVLLAQLPPRGGATVVVIGSHRLVQSLAVRAGRSLHSAEAKRRLWAEQPWFAALATANDQPGRVRRFMDEGAVIDEVAVRVVEMTGDIGDVFFMHPCLLHAPSTNARTQPRLVLTQWIEGKPAR